jgi:hypothetical protein
VVLISAVAIKLNMTAIDEPKKRPRDRIPKTLRTLVWDEYVGLDNGSTLCICGTKIYQMNFECGHVIPHSKGGEASVENLRPICSMCNKSMGNTNYFDFIKDIGIKNPDDIDLSDFVIVPYGRKDRHVSKGTNRSEGANGAAITNGKQIVRYQPISLANVHLHNNTSLFGESVTRTITKFVIAGLYSGARWCFTSIRDRQIKRGSLLW